MPLDGNQLDELLSGFIDGQLTAAERQMVEQAIAGDSSFAERVEQLRLQSLSLRALGDALLAASPVADSRRNQTLSNSPDSRANPNAPNPNALSTQVIKLAQQRAAELGLPAKHYLRSDSTGVDVPLPDAALAISPTVLREPVQAIGSQLRRWLAVGALAATAATVLVIANTGRQPAAVPTVTQHNIPAEKNTRPKFPTPSEIPQTELLAESASTTSSSEPTRPPADSNLVGQFGTMSLVLVVDVQVTSRALRSGAVDRILATAGIPLAPAVTADQNILKALDESRLVVRGQSGVTGDVFVHVVRGDMIELDSALRTLWQDRDSFPNVGLNVSIDARATLAREMLRSLGNRYSASDRFAVPLVSAPTEATTQDELLNSPSSGGTVAGSSPFPASQAGQLYISNNQRARGWNDAAMLPTATPTAQSDAMVTILLVLHRVD